MPSTFLPSGSAPIVTGGTQRKSKSPKSPANRGTCHTGNAGAVASLAKGVGGQKTAKSGIKRSDLAEIAVAPVACHGQAQQQQFTAVTVDTTVGANQLFPHSTTTTVLVAAGNPGVAQMTGSPRIPSTSQQNGALGQAPAFLLQQQQHQQYQQQALLAAQSKLKIHDLKR